MISASLNRCKGMEDQVGDFLKQLAAKLGFVLLIFVKSDQKKDIRQFMKEKAFVITEV